MTQALRKLWENARSLEPLEPAGDPDVERRVRIEVARLQQAQAPISFVGNIFSAAIFWFLGRQHFPGMLEWVTTAYILFVNMAHLWLWRFEITEDPAGLRRWVRTQALLAYAVALWPMVIGSLFQVGGEAGVESLAAWLAVSFVAGFAFAMVPMPGVGSLAIAAMGAVIAFNYLLVGTLTSYLIAMSLLSLTGLAVYYMYNLSLALHRSIRLRVRNESLVTELEIQKNAAEQANLAKSRFFAAASHDLRQPLHALSLISSALRPDASEAERSRIFSHMTSNISALEAQFSMLLDLSRLDVGEISAEKRHFPLLLLFDMLRNRFETEAEGRGVALLFKVSDDIVCCDPLMLERVLSNLITNALNATAQGGTVWVAYRPVRGCVEVRDNGVGIPAEALPKIFDEFYQVSNPARNRRKGLGLGLATVKRLVALMGEGCTVRSTPGVGTVFSVSVARGDPLLVDQQPDECVFDMSSLIGMRVLVIDDDEDILEAFRLYAEAWSCDLRCADTLDAALRILDAGFVPEVTIVDYWLGGGCDGLQTAAYLRARRRDMRIVMMTGDTRLATHGLQASDSMRVLYKPVTAERLQAVLVSLREPLAAAC